MRPLNLEPVAEEEEEAGRPSGATSAGCAPGGRIGPSPCVTAQSASVPAGSSHWEVVDGPLMACGEPAGYLNSDESFKNHVLSLEFRSSEVTNSGGASVPHRRPEATRFKSGSNSRPASTPARSSARRKRRAISR